jgi:uncharacterized protein (TIGR03083 family)
MTVEHNGPVGDRPVVAELAETWRSLADLCASLDPGEWDRPTDCPGWSVRDHVSHVIGIESGLLGRPAPAALAAEPAHVRNDIGRMNERWVEARRGRSGPEVLAELEEVTAERLRALRAMDDEAFAAESWTPAGPSTYEGFMAIRVFDCWTHEQDVRRAVDRTGHLSGPAAEQALSQAATGLPYVVGKRAAAPEGSTVVFEVHGPVRRTWAVGVTEGRARPLDRPPAVPTARLVTDFETFMTLVCGRRDPAQALADHRVRLEGEEGLGRAVTEHLGYVI